MELIFADDSGKDARVSTYIIEAAVCFHESHLRSLEAHITDLKQRFGIPERHELHWHVRKYKRRVQQEWRIDRELHAEEHRALRRAFLEFLAQSDATVIIAAVEWGRSRVTAPLIAQCLEFVAERAQMHLQDLYHRQNENVLGLLIADEPGSRDEARDITRRLQRLHRQGTQWISGFDNLVMNSLLYPSHLVPGIQLADFVAGAADRALNRGEEEWWNLLVPHVRHRRGAPSRLLGYGLKVWPEQRPLRIGNVTVS
jgi:hypothetical protein